MKTVKRGFVVLFAVLLLVSMLNLPVFAAGGTRLVVHYYSGAGSYENVAFAVEGLNGEAAGAPAAGTDGYGLTLTWDFADAAADAYLGITPGEGMAFAGDKRYVRASGGLAEVWMRENDAAMYAAPAQVDDAAVVWKDGKPYMSLEDNQAFFGINAFAKQQNYNNFDGNAAGQFEVLYVQWGTKGDYFEIAPSLNKIIYNSVGATITSYGRHEMFYDVDGFTHTDEKYYVSLDYLGRVFQRTHQMIGGRHYFLTQQATAYDKLSYASPESVGFDSEKLALVDEYIQSEIDAGFPSAAIIVTKDGKIVKESAYGYAKVYTDGVDGEGKPAAVLLDVEDRDPLTTDTMFDLASNTKMYATNYAIQKLVSEGKLDITQKLNTFPGWEGFTDDADDPEETIKGKDEVTVEMILFHRAGLIPDPEYPNRNNAYGGNWYQCLNEELAGLEGDAYFAKRQEVIDVLCNTPLSYTPGSRMSYSDQDYMILGLLIEQISGMRLDEYMQEEIYGPMGIEDTHFNPLLTGKYQPSDFAATEVNGNTRQGQINFGTTDDGENVYIRTKTIQGEVHDEKAFYTMGGISGHAGLFSNVGDMAALTQVMLNGGIYNGQQFFTQEVVDDFTLTPNPSSATYSRGWMKHSSSGTGLSYFRWGPSRATYGHQGWTGTLTLIDPVYNISITILTSQRHSPMNINPSNTNSFVASLSPFTLYTFQRAIGRVYAALKTGPEAANEPAMTKAALQETYNAVTADLKPMLYTQASYAALESAVATASAVLAKDVYTAAEIKAANDGLIAAFSALLPLDGGLELQVLSEMVNGPVVRELEKREAYYTEESFGTFMAMLIFSRNLLADRDAADVFQIHMALSGLSSAVHGLKPIPVDTSGLVQLIAEQQAILDAEAALIAAGQPGLYTPDSVTALQGLVNAANALLTKPDLTFDEVNTMYGDLVVASTRLYEAGEKKGLEALLVWAKALQTAEIYTEASRNALAEAINKAQAVVNDPNANTADVTSAYDELLAATGNMVRIVDKSALNIAISAAATIINNTSLYVPSSLVGLEEALVEANYLYYNDDATQEEVERALAKLVTESAQARLQAQKSKLRISVGMVRAMNFSLYTAASVADVQAALDEADKILADSEIGENKQHEVDAAEGTLVLAAQALVPNPAPPPVVTPPQATPTNPAPTPTYTPPANATPAPGIVPPAIIINVPAANGGEEDDAGAGTGTGNGAGAGTRANPAAADETETEATVGAARANPAVSDVTAAVSDIQAGADTLAPQDTPLAGGSVVTFLSTLTSSAVWVWMLLAAAVLAAGGIVWLLVRRRRWNNGQ